ncbi:MAG: NADH-quinone oxidoreductase subunit J [Kiritimatiellaeota bacterium]|nr:NADH-quinone oxidoreductase subunit J [Kiritimatiellota bacterium]
MACSLLLILQKNPMHSVLYLAFTVLAIAGVFFTLQADFVGAIQLLVYAGGIVVLYLFVIIIINLNQMKTERRRIFPFLFLVAVPLLVLTELGYILMRGIQHGPEGATPASLPKLARESASC